MELSCDDRLIQDGTFIHMIKYFLQCHGNEELQYEASWIFTNIAAGSSEQVKIVSRKKLNFMTCLVNNSFLSFYFRIGCRCRRHSIGDQPPQVIQL